MRAHNDDRNSAGAHDLTKHEGPIHGCAYDFNVLITLQNLREQLAHERGIVYDQHSYFFVAHAVAPFFPEYSPIPRSLPSLEITAAMFSTRTTVPSPKMEAPLT